MVATMALKPVLAALLSCSSVGAWLGPAGTSRTLISPAAIWRSPGPIARRSLADDTFAEDGSTLDDDIMPTFSDNGRAADANVANVDSSLRRELNAHVADYDDSDTDYDDANDRSEEQVRGALLFELHSLGRGPHEQSHRDALRRGRGGNNRADSRADDRRATVAAIEQLGLLTSEKEAVMAIGALGRVGDAARAVATLRALPFAPTPKCYAAAITACGRSSSTAGNAAGTAAAAAVDGGWARALELLVEMDRAGVPPDVGCYNAALRALEGAKQWERALALLRRMGGAANVESFNAALYACVKGGEPRRTLALFDAMVRSAADAAAGLGDGGSGAPPPPPDHGSYAAAIMACDHMGDWQRAIELLREVDYTIVKF